MEIIKISKNQIPSLDYEGYLWKANASEPEVFDSKKITDSELQEMPFVIEGLLYAKEDNISIRIVNIDGAYVITKMDVEGFEAKDVQAYKLDNKKFSGKGKINLYQHYEKKADTENEGWMVWQPTWFAFVGF